MKMVKCLTEFDFFTAFLMNRNFISKIRISKIADYAALNMLSNKLLTIGIPSNWNSKKCEKKSTGTVHRNIF